MSIDNIDRSVLDSFVNGLPSELLIRVRLEGYRDLDDDITKTIQVNKSLKAEKLRRKPYYSNTAPNYPRADARATLNQNNSSEPRMFYKEQNDL